MEEAEMAEEMAEEMEGGGCRGELPAADGSQSQ